jgi:hypothetical protein
MSKDYYKMLGVQEDADESVIRAAYLALSKKYNLDDWKGQDKQQAIKILAEINEAYSVLKDRYERLEYNSGRQKEKQQADAIKLLELTLTSEELESAWKVASNYYDDLDVLYFNLFQISELAANNFKYALLSSKDFSNRNKLAAKFELDYLKNEFGNDQDLINFGRELILEKAKDAVSELHQVVSVMGNSVHAEEVIDKISEKYQTNRFHLRKIQIEQSNSRSVEEAIRVEETQQKIRKIELESQRKRSTRLTIIFITSIVVIFSFFFGYTAVKPKWNNQNSSIKSPVVINSYSASPALMNQAHIIAEKNAEKESIPSEVSKVLTSKYLSCITFSNDRNKLKVVSVLPNCETYESNFLIGDTLDSCYIGKVNADFRSFLPVQTVIYGLVNKFDECLKMLNASPGYQLIFRDDENNKQIVFSKK